MPFILTTTAFKDGAPIPGKYTCDGVDVSPPLALGGARQGRTDFRRPGYGGPCPPPGPAHRYFFTLYALDARLELKAGAQKKDVEAAMQGHVLGSAQLMG